jgi:peptidoglycan/LPS O-acetylase OafA/YrhL
MTAAGTRAPFISRAPQMKLIGGFDGFRGTGMLMVLFVHTMSTQLESWATIVDSFFVVSGFLITTLLLQEVRSTGTISLRKFYMRRAVRLLPSVWVFGGVWLVVSLIATAIGFEPLHLRHIGVEILAVVGYVYHLFFPLGLAVIEPAIQEQRTMWHLWTLSVEEWFYVVIAGTVLVCVRRMWVKQLGVLMMIGVVAIGVARYYAYTGFFQDSEGVLPGIRMAFMQRPDGLMLGVALAVLNAHLTAERIERLRRPAVALATVSFFVWLFTMNLSSEAFARFGLPYTEYLPAGPEGFSRPQMMETMYWFRYGHSICVLMFAVVTFALVHYRGWWLDRLWSIPQLQWVGRLSYTLYIWHALVYVLLFSVTGGDDVGTAATLLRAPVLMAAAFAISIPVYYLVEMRALKFKLRYSAESEALDRTTGRMVDVPRRDGAPGEPGAPST